MVEPAKDTLTGQTIQGGICKAYIVYFDEKENAYREATFASFTNLMIWLGRTREAEGLREGDL